MNRPIHYLRVICAEVNLGAIGGSVLSRIIRALILAFVVLYFVAQFAAKAFFQQILILLARILDAAKTAYCAFLSFFAEGRSIAETNPSPVSVEYNRAGSDRPGRRHSVIRVVIDPRGGRHAVTGRRSRVGRVSFGPAPNYPETRGIEQ